MLGQLFREGTLHEIKQSPPLELAKAGFMSGKLKPDEFKEAALGIDSTAGREMLMNMGLWEPEPHTQKELLRLFAEEQAEADSRVGGTKTKRPIHSNEISLR